MLRRAAEIIGADKVLVITHRPQTIEKADSRILVADGKVTV
jgi:ABC-type multidrug transport system fused ATPase/permease subunit